MFSLKQFLLLEYTGTIDMVNASKPIIIVNGKGKPIAKIGSFVDMIDKVLKFEIFSDERFRGERADEIKKWYMTNFTSWLKRGALDKEGRSMFPALYTPLDTYIEELAEFSNVSYQQILDQIPYGKNKQGTAADNAVVFAKGQITITRRLQYDIHDLTDYLLALALVKHNLAPPALIPPHLVVRRFDTFVPYDALQKSQQWHVYMAEHKHDFERAKALALLASLQPDVDMKVVREWPDGVKMVKMLSAVCAQAESGLMRHCVQVYGKEIEAGTSKIYSLRQKNGEPVCTIALDGDEKHAREIKGKNNGFVNAKYHRYVQEWLVERDITFSQDEGAYIGATSLAQLKRLFQEENK